MWSFHFIFFFVRHVLPRRLHECPCIHNPHKHTRARSLTQARAGPYDISRTSAHAYKIYPIWFFSLLQPIVKVLLAVPKNMHDYRLPSCSTLPSRPMQHWTFDSLPLTIPFVDVVYFIFCTCVQFSICFLAAFFSFFFLFSFHQMHFMMKQQQRKRKKNLSACKESWMRFLTFNSNGVGNLATTGTKKKKEQQQWTLWFSYCRTARTHRSHTFLPDSRPSHFILSLSKFNPITADNVSHNKSYVRAANTVLHQLFNVKYAHIRNQDVL